MSGNTPSDVGKLSNPFSKDGNDRDGFIGFSASTPQTQNPGHGARGQSGGNFQPR